MIRNDPGGDYGEGVGGQGSAPAGFLDQFLNGRFGNITPVYDRFGNLTGYRQGFAGDGRGAQGAGGTSSGGGGAAIPTGTGAATTATETAATGAGLGSWLKLAGQIAPILGGLENGRASGRSAAAAANQAQSRAEADIFRTRTAAALEGPRKSAQDAAYGDTLANIQPFSWLGSTHMVGNIPVPDSSGGMGPQNFGPATRQAGRDLSTLGASRVKSPSFDLPDPPTLAPLPEAGAADSWLTGGSTIASILAAYNLWNQGRNKTGTLPRTTGDNPDFTNGIG